MEKKSFLKKKKITAVISIFSLIAGFMFLNQDITGNVILESNPSFNPLTLIGLLLVFCSAILALYSIKK